MGKLDIDISAVKKLVELVESYNLEELTVEEGDLSVTVKGRTAKVAPVVVQSAAHPAFDEPTHEHEDQGAVIEEAAPEEEIDGNIVNITAPIVGVYYASPAPDAAPFVAPGDTIEVGTEVGLIEAMKVFSPIPSEIAGTVVEVVAPNGKLVQQGDVLIRVRIEE